MFASQWGTKSLRRAGVLRIRWYLRRRCISEAGSCSWGTGSQDAPRFLFWEFHAYRLSHDCARLLICGISGLQKGTSGWKEGFAATAHQALSGARANFLANQAVLVILTGQTLCIWWTANRWLSWSSIGLSCQAIRSWVRLRPHQHSGS